MPNKISQKEAQKRLLSLVVEEIEKYEKAQYWITDKVAFNMREMLKQFRKNYWGVYDDPIDRVTKKAKLWVPLTQMLVDAVRKNVDLDPKDVRFRSTNVKSSHMTHLVRGYVHRWLSRNYFNHTLDQTTFTMSVDGTDVWKTYFQDGKIVRKDVDLLNVYIDPTADSIQDAYRFTERILMTEGEAQAMDWENTDKFAVDEELEKEGDSTAKKQGKFGDAYESWGLYPKWLVLAANGKDYSDEDMAEAESHIVISGIDTGKVLFHLAEENTTKDNEGNIIKPYEEAWYSKVPGRWYGKGIAETVMPMQEWINTVVNLRIKKNTVAQLGLLKIRRGSKVTQQMLQNLVSKGVIEVANMDDIDNMRVDEAGQSSYQDEQTARGWAQDVTSVFDASLGDLPASTSATGAVIQDRQQKSAFALVTESNEYFIQRWMDRHFLPNIPKMMKRNGMVTFFKDFDDIKQVRENVIATLAMEQLAKRKTLPTEQELEEALQRAERKLENQKDLFIEIVEDIIAEGLETEVFMTNAEIDVAVTVRNLLELRNGLPPDVVQDMTAEAMDLLGLRVPQSLRTPPQPQQEQLPQGAAPQGQPTEQSLVTEANTIGNEQR